MTTKTKRKSSPRVADIARAWKSHTATAIQAERHAAPRQLAIRIGAHLQIIEADCEALSFRLRALGEDSLADIAETFLIVVKDLVGKVGDNLLVLTHDVATRYSKRIAAGVDVA